MADRLTPEELDEIRARHHKTNQYCEISGCSWDSHYQANDDRAALLRHVEALEQVAGLVGRSNRGGEVKKATFAPVYAAIYPELAEIARSYGYALAVHGSMQRDFDLVAIPWGAEVASKEAVIEHIVAEFACTRAGAVTEKNHGREVITLAIGFGECFMDLSFMPRVINITAERKLARLEREFAHEFADEHCAILLHSEANCYEDHSGVCWYDVESIDPEYMDPSREFRYLELRGLLERHPDNPNLVRIKEGGE